MCHYHGAETDAGACVLVNILPTTMAGVIALLRYAVDADTDGQGWPELHADVDDPGVTTRGSGCCAAEA